MPIKMITQLLLATLLFASVAEGQKQSSRNAKTTASCSPANTGDNNIYIFKWCGSDPAQGIKIIAILNKVLANQNSKEIDSKLDQLLEVVSRPIAVTSATNGIAIGGGTVTNPTITNNNYAEKIPSILGVGIVTKDTPNVTLFPNYNPPKTNTTTVAFYTDVAWDNAHLAVLCDRPCHAIEFGPAQPPAFMMGPVFRVGRSPDKPNLAYFVIDVLIHKDTYYLLTVQSDDNLPVLIQSVERMELPSATR